MKILPKIITIKPTKGDKVVEGRGGVGGRSRVVDSNKSKTKKTSTQYINDNCG